MLGGVEAAKRALRRHKDNIGWGQVSGDAFENTLEYLVVQNRYRRLFSPKDLKAAEKRLAWNSDKTVNRNLYKDPFGLKITDRRTWAEWEERFYNGVPG
jgi:hypothetical protein